MHFKGLRKKHKRATGSALVETAIALPFIFILLFGLYQVGWLAWAYVVMSDTAGASVRHLATLGLNIEQGCFKDFTGLHKQQKPTQLGELHQWLAQKTAASLLNRVYGKDLELFHYVDNGGDKEKAPGALISSMFVSASNPLSCQGDYDQDMLGVRVEGYLKLPFLPLEVKVRATEKAPFLKNTEPKTSYIASGEAITDIFALTNCGGMTTANDGLQDCIQVQSEGEHPDPENNDGFENADEGAEAQPSPTPPPEPTATPGFNPTSTFAPTLTATPTP